MSRPLPPQLAGLDRMLATRALALSAAEEDDYSSIESNLDSKYCTRRATYVRTLVFVCLNVVNQWFVHFCLNTHINNPSIL